MLQFTERRGTAITKPGTWEMIAIDWVVNKAADWWDRPREDSQSTYLNAL
jgi:hypothetical protein